MIRKPAASTPNPPYDPERSALINLLRQQGITPHKRLGQVFLFKQSVAEEIVRFAEIHAEDVVVEIGSGLGILTLVLAQSGARLVGLEYDSRLAAYLAGALRCRNAEIHRADALHFDYPGLARRSGVKLVIIGNLPYYLTSPLMFKLIDVQSCISRMVLMIQHEVAERISAPPGTSGYGVLSILTQLYFQVAHRLTVVKDCFYPLPAVDSDVVVCTRRDRTDFALADEKAFATLVRVSFAHPRKTLINAFKACNYFNRGKEGMVAAMEGAGIDPGRRPHTLSIDEYVRLSNMLSSYHSVDG